MTDDPPIAVLVLGMHRSGTSAMTRLIGELGASLPLVPNPASDDNPEGYWEPAEIVRLNDALLRAMDSSWLDTRPLDLARLPQAARATFRTEAMAALRENFADARCYVVKDPRICRMVPLYREVLEAAGADIRVVLVLRDPHAVAASLAGRNQMSRVYAGLLWARHLIEAERHTRDLPRVFVAYEEALVDWRRAAGRVRTLLGIKSEGDGDGILRAEMQHHYRRPASLIARELAVHLEPLFTALLDLRARDDAPARAEIDRLANAVEGMGTAVHDATTAEFCFQRLTSPYDTALPLDPLADRRAFAASLDAVCTQSWRVAAGSPVLAMRRN